ncbi:hypothetical protein [Psychroflexus salis]|uniref:Uncharacterized protein n=1 Tax=Psychroflexus salis TaxID=1526574 RepID=A0A917A264_9FLAO|nr:hypothetical protein [Psychroflexus salis]GGE23035.1 hypothetical protein GCM10010831_24920 [Psychroflexus salis]
MRILFITLLLITKISSSQENVELNVNALKYEINDEFERFNDIRDIVNINKLHYYFKSDSILIIENDNVVLSGTNIKLIINNKLQIKDATYNFWTDNPNPEVILSYKVTRVNLILNQNPFKTISGFRGNYNLEIQEYSNDSLIDKYEYKGKFKSFEEISKESVEYKWVVNQNKPEKNYINSNGVYINPEVPPTLKSNYNGLIKEIRKIEKLESKNIRAFIVINEKGKIEKSPIRYSYFLNDKQKSELTKLLIEYTEWYPACVDEIAVKSQIPLIISIE